MIDGLKWQSEIYPYLGQRISKYIEKLPTSTLCNISKIRLRANGAVSVTVGNKNTIVYNEKNEPLSLELSENSEIFTRLCNGTVYQFENQIKNGYITIQGGHRVGFCGTAIYEGDRLVTLKDITSITFRISRQIKNAAREIIGNIINDDKIYSALIVSEPCGGKTTILSDLARLVSNLGKRCAVVDERGEICSVYEGVPQKDIGSLTDVLNGYSKGDGMMTALRCLSPQLIICDEIGSRSDADAMLEAMNAGVPVIATAHASNEDDLLGRPQIERLVDYGAIDKIFFLQGNANPGVVRKVITVNRYDEDSWNSDDCG